MQKIFETHAHYEDEKFDEDREEVLGKVKNAGVYRIVNVGSSLETSLKSVELANAREEFYAAVGIHPDHADECDEAGLLKLRTMAADKRVKAIGEIGLDYYWDTCDREVQKQAFRSQLDLALELNLPVIIHSREACEDTLVMMREYTSRRVEKGSPSSGVIHCFGYSKEVAMEYVRMGYFIGIGGVVTFKNARKLVEVVEAVPMEKIVLETDCPYLTPVPFRSKRNDSSKLRYVADKISEIKGISPEEVIDITRINALELYRFED